MCVYVVVCVCVCLCVSPAGQHIGLNPFCDYINCPELTLKCVCSNVCLCLSLVYMVSAHGCVSTKCFCVFVCLCLFLSICCVCVLCLHLFVFAFVCCICVHVCGVSLHVCVCMCVLRFLPNTSHPPSLPNTLPVGHKCPHNSRRLRRQGCTLC